METVGAILWNHSSFLLSVKKITEEWSVNVNMLYSVVIEKNKRQMLCFTEDAVSYGDSSTKTKNVSYSYNLG